jgi:hypothetical protein
MVQATRAHNGALVERVQALAKRVEEMTAENQKAERMQEEFYLHCQDYIEKKKAIEESNRSVKEKLGKEREQSKELER